MSEEFEIQPNVQVQDALAETAELEAFFDAQAEHAAEFDAKRQLCDSTVASLLSSYNKRRVTVRADAIAVTYIQGLPTRELAERMLAGSVPGHEVIAALVKAERIRTRKTRSEGIVVKQEEGYLALCRQGLYAKEFIEQVKYELAIPDTTALINLLYPKPNKQSKDSFSGAMFTRGLVEYVKSTRALLAEVEAAIPEGDSVLDRLFPKTTLAKGADELLRFALDNDLDIGEAEL